LEYDPYKVLAGLGPDNSVVGLVRPQALKKIQGNLAADEYRVYSIEQDLKNGEGLYEPVVVAYDPKTGYAVVAEGNHRVQAAIEAGEEFIPVVVRTNEVSKKKKGEFTPGKVEKTSGNFYSPEVEEGETREVNPYFVFPDSDILTPEEGGFDQSAPNLDNLLSILDKYRTKPAEGSSSPAPAVSEGTPGSKTNPLKLSTEEFTAKQAQVSDNNKTASQGVLAFVKEQLSRKNLSSWVQGYSRNKTRPLPVNPASDTHYRGANLVALEQAAEENGFSDPRWMTATQVARAGGSIPAGTKGTKILVPTQLVTEVDGEIREIYEFKSVTVFNGDQIDGLAPYDSDSKKSYTAQEAVDIVLDRLREAADARGGSTPEIFGVQLGKDQNPRWMPNYSGVEKLRLPLRANFKSDEAWFQALAHELIHSTGSKDRLDRPELKTGLDRDADITDRSDSIAKEELTAELGSMILARMFGLGIDEENSARYLNFHINDRKLSEKDVNDAFSRAQLAVDHLLGNDVLPEWNPESTKVPPTPQSVRMIASTPESSSLNPDTNPDTVDAPAMGFDQATKKSYGASKSVGNSKDAKERVLAGLLEKIKEGKAPWRKPFKDDANLAGAFVPRNPASKHIYTGINSLVLKLSQQIGGYSDPRWMTYNQAQELGGQVRKGEKGVQILIPFKNVRREKDSATGEEKVAGSYVTFGAKAVFNVEQIDGLNLPSVKDEAGEPKTPLEAQDFILDRYQKSMEAKGLKAPKVTYTYVGNYGSHSSSPNWSPSADVITLPTQEQFNSPEDMFDTIAHELAHSTGHKDRLDRTELTKDYGTDNAARGKEELIAEISSAILASMFGVNSDFDNTAAYVQSWLEALQNNPEMVMSASSDAQKVVDYLLGMDLGDWSPIEGYKSSTKSKSDGDSNE
jgi:antirestriction protein ArdC